MRSLRTINPFVIVSTTLLFFALYGACFKKDVTKNFIKKELFQTSLAVKQEDDISKEKQELISRMQVIKGKISKQMEVTREESLSAKEGAVKTYSKNLSRLESWSKKIDMHIKETQAAPADKWQEFKAGMTKSLDELERQLEQLKKDLEKLIQREKDKKHV